MTQSGKIPTASNLQHSRQKLYLRPRLVMQFQYRKSFSIYKSHHVVIISTTGNYCERWCSPKVNTQKTEMIFCACCCFIYCGNIKRNQEKFLKLTMKSSKHRWIGMKIYLFIYFPWLASHPRRTKRIFWGKSISGRF